MIELEELYKTFRRGSKEIEAVCGMNLKVADEEIVALIGPSGCGKSTLLNIVAGLYAPSQGRVLFNGKEVNNINTSVADMTQKDNLLPWRTILDNVVLLLELLKVGREERNRKADDVIARVGLKGFETQYPNELSGGMRKRACLARMLLSRPSTLLLDEPFAALDAPLKLVMYELLLRLTSENKQTVVFVTHDLTEAVTLADRVVVCARRPTRVAYVQEIDLLHPRNMLAAR